MHILKWYQLTAVAAALLLSTTIAWARPVPEDVESYPVISIIIDDMGMRKDRGNRIVRLPGAVACSFLPHSPYTRKLALHAHSMNKEVLLHLPMQSIHNNPMGPGGLSLNMTEKEFIDALQKDLEAVPHVSGVNNHMGSLLTRHPGHMLWLMQAINRNGKLFFVDSRTTNATVAEKVAHENGIPSMQRDIFLDNNKDPSAIRAQFKKTIERARRTGTALAIGHPYETTISVLEEMLPELEHYKVRLVSVAEMIKLRRQRRDTWQAFLSRSHKAAKN